MPNADLGNPNFFKTFLGRFEAVLPGGGKTPVMLTAMNEVCLMQDLTADSGGLIMTLPEQCRPKNPVRFACVVEKPASRSTLVTVSRQVGTVKGSVQDGHGFAAKRSGWAKASLQTDTVTASRQVSTVTASKQTDTMKASKQTDTVTASRQSGTVKASHKTSAKNASRYVRTAETEGIVGSVDVLELKSTVKGASKTGSVKINNPGKSATGMTATQYDGYSTSDVEVPLLGSVDIPVVSAASKDVSGIVKTPVFEDVEVPVLSDVPVPVLENVEVPVLSDVDVPVLSDVSVPVLENVNVPVMTEVNVPLLSSVEVPILRDVDIPVMENVSLDLEAGNTPETVVTVNPDGNVTGIPGAMHRLNGRAFYVIDRYYL